MTSTVEKDIIDLTTVSDDEVTEKISTLPSKGEISCFYITTQQTVSNPEDAMCCSGWDETTELYYAHFGAHIQVFDWEQGQNIILKRLHSSTKFPMAVGKCVIIHEDDVENFEFFSQREKSTNVDQVFLDGSQLERLDDDSDDEEQPRTKKKRVE